MCDKIKRVIKMKLIVCLDDNNGMMFNKRRQSRDRVLVENVVELCKSEKLYTNEYSAKLQEVISLYEQGQFAKSFALVDSL